MMIPYEQALKLILNNAKKLPFEKTIIDDSVGRILMENIYSTMEMPPFNKSAMDGYAVKAADLKDSPVTLTNIGLIEAGQLFRRSAKKGHCVKIMTGAALPEGTDTVVMVEDTRMSGNQVEIRRKGKRGENVCIQGEDMRKGQKLLDKGAILSTSDVALLATTGRRYVKVIRKPKVAVLNTGGEIIPAGGTLRKRQIYNSNGPQFLALLKSDRIDPNFLGIAKDRPDDLMRSIQKGLEYDVLLISGGVSMGDYDIVPDVLKKLRVRTIFHGVKTKPGRPLLFGKRKNTIVFGVPGNPVSNFFAYHAYIRPALIKMQGSNDFDLKFNEGSLRKSFKNKPGRRNFVLVKVVKKKMEYHLTPTWAHGSADILALSKADGFMVVDEQTHIVKVGEKVKFFAWK